MTWISDPNAWIGLATLIGLEIVLGIDNLVFTAILAERLPPAQRRQARLIGLTLALAMRLGLLAALSFLAQLTRPLVTLGGFSFSGRDLILIGGGAFLLAKGTTELNERIAQGAHGSERRRTPPAFWQVIVQIILLDLVFSLDSIITAIGMVDELAIMMIAVVVAVGVMIFASGPLTAFVGRRPTVVILCLGFLLMIGFSLITDGFGFHVPKAYLYAAIVFSVLVEAANELRRLNLTRRDARASRRERTSNAILRTLGGGAADQSGGADASGADAAGAPPLGQAERLMMHGVLELGERRLRSLMTPRGEVEWLDVTLPEAALRARIGDLEHSCVPLARGRIDELVGVARTRDLLGSAAGPALDPCAQVHTPLVLPDTLDALRAIERLRHAPLRLAIVVDEHGSIQGVVTPFDVLEAIAGDFSATADAASRTASEGAGAWIVDGSQDIRRLGAAIGRDLADAEDLYTTVAGLVLTKLQRLPERGDSVEHAGVRLEVIALDGRNAGRVRIAPAERG